MKLKLLVFLIIALVPRFAQAQSSLTIFSEDGDKFILFLDGAQQNNAGQTNLRIDGLSQPSYKARIVFEDRSKGQVEKNISVNDPATNAPADVVYRIKNKDGEMKLRYFSTQPVQQNFAPPADLHVIHYGQPDQGAQPAVPTNGGSVGITPIRGNGGVNINTNDPNGTVKETTTSFGFGGDADNNGNTAAKPAHADCQYPMDWNNFRSAKETVKNSSFDDDKLSAAKNILNTNCMSTDQVIQICQLFGFEGNKLNFAKFAYPRTTDPNNYSKVVKLFSFEASKTDLNNFISSGGR